MRKYFVYLDDGVNVYKVAIPAVCEEAAIAACYGNGDVVAVVDVTEEYKIDAQKVREALTNAGFKDCEAMWMIRTLEDNEIVGW